MLFLRCCHREDDDLRGPSCEMTPVLNEDFTPYAVPDPDDPYEECGPPEDVWSVKAVIDQEDNQDSEKVPDPVFELEEMDHEAANEETAVLCNLDHRVGSDAFGPSLDCTRLMEALNLSGRNGDAASGSNAVAGSSFDVGKV